MFRRLTWNLNARAAIDGQAAAIAQRVPDIVALQEVASKSAEKWQAALRGLGLLHVTDSFSNSPAWNQKGPRRYGLLIGSRFAMNWVASGVRVEGV